MTSVGDRIGCVTVLEVLEAAQAREQGLRGYRGRPAHPKATGAHMWVRCDCLLEFLVRARELSRRKSGVRCGEKCELGKQSAEVPEGHGRSNCRNPLCGGKLRSDNTTGFCTPCMRGEIVGGRRWYRLSHPEEWRVKERERTRAARLAKALRGECAWCPTPAIDGESLCAACKARERESRRACRKSRMASSAAWRARQMAAGLCVLCAAPAAPDRRRCARHLAEDSAKKLARYHAKKPVDVAREAA